MPATLPAIVYDGQCLLCSSYTRMTRLRLTLGEVRLIDARSADPLVEELRRRGYDLDAGMVFLDGSTIHHGADAVRRLAELTRDPGFMHRALANPAFSRAGYPVLAFGRRLLLGLLGRERIKLARQPASHRRRYHIAIAVGLAAYVLMIQPVTVSFAKQFPGYGVREEIFPFFSWSLYSYPKRRHDKFSIIPLEITERSPIAGRIGQITNGDHKRLLKDSQYKKTALTLFHALRDQDVEAANAAKVPYDNYMRRLGVTRYRFVKLEFDVLANTDYRTIDYGELVAGESVAGFEKPIFEVISQ